MEVILIFCWGTSAQINLADNNLSCIIFLGDIFIHCLANFRPPMEDPPSISEGCGGRVTDYRINVSWSRRI